LKCDANPKEEELPAMKFMRRPDIDTVARVTMAVQAFLGLGVYGEITRIARFYQVSRLFVYKLLWQLLALYTLEVCDPLSVQAIRKEVDRYILLLRLEGLSSPPRKRASLTGENVNQRYPSGICPLVVLPLLSHFYNLSFLPLLLWL